MQYIPLGKVSVSRLKEELESRGYSVSFNRRATTDPEIIKTIEDLLLADYAVAEVVWSINCHGITPEFVNSIRKRKGIPFINTSRAPVLRLCKEGKSATEIAAIRGMSRSAIVTTMKKLGYDLGGLRNPEYCH